MHSLQSSCTEGTICIRQSRHSYLLASHDKFHRTAFYSIPPELAADVNLISDLPEGNKDIWESYGKGYMARIGDLR